MSVVPTKVLKFNSDTLQEVRIAYNLDKPGRLSESIDVLEEWIKKQDYLVKKTYPRRYLEGMLISCKGSVERTKQRLDKLCTMRTAVPHFFTIPDLNFDEYRDFLTTYGFYIHLPRLTDSHLRVGLVKARNGKLPTDVFHMFCNCCVMMMEYVKLHDYNKGYHHVVDLRGVSLMELLGSLNLIELQNVFVLYLEAYGIILKGAHILTSSKNVGYVISVLKTLVSEKIGNRIFAHDSLESLHKVIPKSILPKDYGGDDKSFDDLADDWFDVLLSKEHVQHLEEMQCATVVEEYRQTDRLNDECNGLPGTFRKLNVD